ncbi:MAG: class I SAM-dependent methyltransferase [Chitinophagales bacterium]|nr:class I SAM-dependent methyltransferase [Chitinophagales bacterium]
MSQQKHKHCLICDSRNLKTLERYRKAYLVNCTDCGFTFSSEIPSAAELQAHYQKYGRNDYLSPITIKRYHEILDGFEKYRKNNRLLDVGCGIGYFLKEAQKRGWEVYGTEFTDEAIELCESKGIKMKKGMLDKSMFPENYFDVVTYFEVIEHINNPTEEIANMHEVIRPGGVCYMTTPNFNGLSRHCLKEEYNVITYPEHLSYYTPKTLSNLFKTHGFRTVNLKTTGISLTRIRTSLGTSDQAYISEKSDDELIRKKIEKSSFLKVAKNLVNESLTLFNAGDSIKGHFEKVEK